MSRLSQIDQLMKLKHLYEQGILTKEEMEAEKAKILSISTTKPIIPISESSPETPTEPVVSISKEDNDKSHFKNIILIITFIVVVIFVGYVGYNLVNQKESAMAPVEDMELSQMPDSKTDGYNSILSERRLTEADLTGKSKKELELLRNSIFARYGYRFKRDDLFQHFSQYSWYVPTTSDGSFVIGKMSEVEKYNVDFIKRIEDATSNVDSGNNLKFF